ncbi:MAG: hypothetical protein JXB45_05230 [Candidatus Krumholzibacteriota bacterium]|nr:hypothetical protein [Candidatus Krumholzibacteriota bacterium]
MKKQKILLIIAISSMLFTVCVYSQEEKKISPGVDSLVLKKQTHCPVMGGAVDTTLFMNIQGQRIYFCCPMCIDKFKADPDLLFEKAAAEGTIFENVQTTCPVSGNAINKDFFVYYKGRGIYLCSEKCIDAFDSDPAKYLGKLENMNGNHGEKESIKKHEEHIH